MGDSTKSSAMPRLRFPEFRRAAQWETVSLGEVAEISLGKMLDDKKTKSGRLLPYINNISLRWGYVDTSKLPMMHFADNELERYGLRAGDVLVCEGGEPGRSAVWDGRLPDVKFQKAVHRVRFAIPFEPKLLVAYLEAIAGTIPFEALFTGGGIKHLTRETFSRLRIPLLSLAEQQRIADCLASLDDVIAAQAQKVKALKAHKQGLMQQLFPREGETVPRLRFPEFRDAPEWEADVFDRFVAKSFYGTSSPTSETGQYPVLRMGNMVDGDLDLSRLVYLDMDRESFEAIRLRRGDILLNRTNSPDLVGKISLFTLDMECITASYIVTYRLHEKRLDPSFCNFLLNTPQYRAKVKLLARPSVSQANINPTTFRKELRICVPSLPEQKRIADCLSSLDNRIAAESERLDALRTQKAGLMQQLFPAPTEAE